MIRPPMWPECEEAGCGRRATCCGRSGPLIYNRSCQPHCDHVGEGGIFDKGGATCTPLCVKCGQDVCDCEVPRG